MPEKLLDDLTRSADLRPGGVSCNPKNDATAQNQQSALEGTVHDAGPVRYPRAVQRGCTRQEVKGGFPGQASRPPRQYPDLQGGADLAFPIQLRARIRGDLGGAGSASEIESDTDLPSRAHRDIGATNPRDPTGYPYPTLREETPHVQHMPKSPDPVYTKDAFIGLLHRVSEKTSRRRPTRLAKLARTVGMLFLSYFMLFFPIVALVNVSVTYLELEKHADFAGRSDSLHVVVAVTVFLGPLLLASWLIYKYDIN